MEHGQRCYHLQCGKQDRQWHECYFYDVCDGALGTGHEWYWSCFHWGSALGVHLGQRGLLAPITMGGGVPCVAGTDHGLLKPRIINSGYSSGTPLEWVRGVRPHPYKFDSGYGAPLLKTNIDL